MTPTPPTTPIPDRPQSPARRRLLKQAAGSVAALAALAGTDAYGHEVEADRLVVTQTDVRLAGWPAAAAGLRVGQLSDLHCDNPRAVRRARRAVQMLLAQHPDVVFLTGDYISYKPHAWVTPAADAVAPLAQALPGRVFGVLGNHDWWSHGQEILTDALGKRGVTVLRNRSAPLPSVSGVWVVGLDDRCKSKQDPVLALAGVPAGALKLLLVHEPDYADEAPPGFTLQLSGHSHGGQIRLPGLPPLHTPRYGRQYPEGLRQARHHPVYTTRGVGLMGPQMRLFCPPEVTVLRLFPA